MGAASSVDVEVGVLDWDGSVFPKHRVKVGFRKSFIAECGGRSALTIGNRGLTDFQSCFQTLRNALLAEAVTSIGLHSGSQDEEKLCEQLSIL